MEDVGKMSRIAVFVFFIDIIVNIIDSTLLLFSMFYKYFFQLLFLF